MVHHNVRVEMAMNYITFYITYIVLQGQVSIVTKSIEGSYVCYEIKVIYAVTVGVHKCGIPLSYHHPGQLD